MKLIIRKQIGDLSYPFEFEGNNLHECVMESQKLSFPDVMKCGSCSSTRLRLGARVTGAENYEYTFIKCLDCKAELTFGQKKKGDVFYLRRNDDKSFAWKVYDDKSKNESQSQSNNKSEDSSDDDLPF